MVIRKYLGADRQRILALKAFRDELLAIENTYQPFHAEFKSVFEVIKALDAMADTLLGEQGVYTKPF